jgi:hypothetical protein
MIEKKSIELEIIKEAPIIVSTLMSCKSTRLESVKFTKVIVDEAA